MAKDSNADIDPRFDPAFQRGFDPSIPIEESVPVRQQRRPAAPAVVDSPAPAPHPVAAAPASAPSAPSAPPAPPAVVPAPAPIAAVAVIDATVPDEVDGGESAVEEAAQPSAARNPFLLFLGIIAVALIAVGVWLFVRSGEAFNSKEVRSQGDYMSLTATINMAPFIALLGAATAIGVLFVFASRWKRRR
ncbi:MAG TPA: hypothetical protein VHX87_06660 [Galbitalea sp.]|jgi:hypothetical protein|nr:hypothetical protein [Galbitalea sp.]